MPKKIKPITPDEVSQAKETATPDEVFETFNELIVQNWTGSKAVVKQDDVVALTVAKMGMEARAQIFSRHWLDVENHYQRAGWNVAYDAPAYNEDYEASFVFTKS